MDIHLENIDPDSNYYDILSREHVFSIHESIGSYASFYQYAQNSKNLITVFNQNIRSFNKNLDPFLCMFSEDHMPDVFIFSETWHDLNSPVFIPGFTGYHTIRNTGRSGGVSIFVRNDFSSCKIDELSFSSISLEICTVKISSSDNEIHVCGIYRPHSGTIENFCESIEHILNDRQLLAGPIVIAGDFNINLISDGQNIAEFSGLMRSSHYLQVITDVTHPGSSVAAASLIDHIWTNQMTSYYSGLIKTGITDHHTTYIKLPFKAQKSNSNKIKVHFREDNENNRQYLETLLINFDWTLLKHPDINVYVLNFIKNLNKLYQKAFPIKSKTISQKRFQNPWYTPDIKKLTVAREKYHSLHLLGLVTTSEYSRFRNKITSAIRKAKATYYQRLFGRNAGNPKATWQTIRSICHGHQPKLIEKIVSNNITYTEVPDIVELFNNFFIKIANELDSNLTPTQNSPYTYVKANVHSPIVMHPISEFECSNIINSLKLTKEDIDTIPVKIFKLFHPIFLSTLCDMINTCFLIGLFPDPLKHAKVIPIFKKGERTNLTNYRPVALLHFLSKIFERSILNRLSNYATYYDLLSPQQFGFRKKKSTADAISLLTERIYDCFNNRKLCLNVFVDLQKAFDTINYKILLKKLQIYGIQGIPLKLIENYLSNRTQSVRIEDSLSTPKSITIGLPQGSLLGPLLFLFFINDLPNISDKFKSILFADDTTLSFETTTQDELNIVCNHELSKFYSWTLANRLTINFGKNKTYYILHTFTNINSDSLQITINNKAIESVNEGEFLGVIIDNNLKFQAHVHKVCNKISKSIGIMYKLRNYVSLCVMKQVYYSLIYPYLNYCIRIYAATYSTHLTRLFILQKRAIRIINRESYLAHTNDLFKSNNILKVPDIYRLNVGLYMYDNRRTGHYERNHSHNTRFRSDLIPSRARLTITQNSINVVGPNIWNSIPDYIKESPSRNSFKYQYKQFLLSAYSTEEAT